MIGRLVVDSKCDVVYADDLVVGGKFALGSYTVTEQEVVEFAGQWDPQSFHIDRESADDGYFGGLIASGVHTIAVCQRLSALTLYAGWSVIAGKQMRDVNFLRPVRPGDVLTGNLVVEDVVPDDRGRALVTVAAEILNGSGKQVLTSVTEMYMRCRPETD
ncbi:MULTISPECIES: MaoC/PaaZ C-terminal domain-containing protein [unclassified Rhodococcus (in: high G+C Gram-positive bacteria)]|uniref:MaoC/PaaZ C-terminal domain-containing protein n=1 Tax=unclassified Rhodococcus (in: high G+C Gram-positive bacteria) TaxID=192944 RepID=UPI00163AE823|nr:MULTISPECIES: MaoC/PaaZ C-terminal domain-containing protein [unclassified Rhodococcus (in: high G+C Gram-positive bacteria)]MBC2639113.1 MaoC family dehydratase N-terminal domain-containing protein [Rhodococcus sp. 3A]MBC2896145.1 MaoC family dehydratase N-terminal domain-containing protein [Rhodococcus sp. 4CII]